MPLGTNLLEAAHNNEIDLEGVLTVAFQCVNVISYAVLQLSKRGDCTLTIQKALRVTLRLTWACRCLRRIPGVLDMPRNCAGMPNRSSSLKL